MGWFVAVDRTNHPCRTPDAEEMKQHRPLEFWRCEVCDDLFQLRRSTYTFIKGLPTLRLDRITSPWLRWRYRKEGYASDQVS